MKSRWKRLRRSFLLVLLRRREADQKPDVVAERRALEQTAPSPRSELAHAALESNGSVEASGRVRLGPGASPTTPRRRSAPMRSPVQCLPFSQTGVSRPRSPIGRRRPPPGRSPIRILCPATSAPKASAPPHTKRQGLVLADHLQADRPWGARGIGLGVPQKFWLRCERAGSTSPTVNMKGRSAAPVTRSARSPPANGTPAPSRHFRRPAPAIEDRPA